MNAKKRITAILSAALLTIPIGLAVIDAPEAQAAACYSASASANPFNASARVNYGSCRTGITRSQAHVNTTADSGWYAGSTDAWAGGVNMIIGGPWAKTFTSGLR